MTYLNAFVHLLNFSCIIFHLFSIVVQVLCHTTGCSTHNIDVFVSILDHFVQYPNRLTFLVKFPNNRTTIDTSFCRKLTNFWNVNSQPIFFVKTCNDVILPFVKGLNLKQNLQEWKLFCDGSNYGLDPYTYLMVHSQ